MDLARADALNAAIRAIGMRHRALAATLLAPLGLYPGQEILLLDLDAHGPRTQVQLATASGCEPPTITGSVRKLEDAGLVVRSPRRPTAGSRSSTSPTGAAR
ncbi:MAG: MarR family transcriptional regulator [Actinomycetota bacterium]|nr:MarR family transcriptional regulator [Actinomycetota bacterium]